MGEFSSADAIKPRWDPSLKSRAVRRFLAFTAALLAAAVLGYLHLLYFGLERDALPLMLVVAGPAATAGLTLTVALVIQCVEIIARIIVRIPLLIFLGAVVGVVLLVWAHLLVFGFIDQQLIADETVNKPGQTTAFGGPLTIEEIQTRLLTAQEVAANQAADAAQEPLAVPPFRGQWAMLAYPLWPLQFRLVRDLIGITAVVGFVSLVAMFSIWWERKVAGRIQSRLGPMRVGGWHGWAQSPADGLKLMQKEDIIPGDADRVLFRLAPYAAFIPALSAFIALPFGAAFVFRELDVALIFILAMLGVEVVGVILAGWASNNKWSVYGAMREACQMVSYEIPMGMSLLVPIMAAGTLNLEKIGSLQSGGFHTWLAFSNPLTFIAALTYCIAALASCKRAPFDLPEAESELVAGFHTEYSGFRWSLFFFAEYAAMFVVSGLATILFFGAWHSPLPAAWGQAWAEGPLWKQALHGVLFSGPIWFLIKSFFLVYVQMWIRWTLPRVRLDQVMYACVQVLLPFTMLVLLASTIWGLAVNPAGLLARTANVVLTLIGAGFVGGFFAIMIYGYSNRRRLVGTLAVDVLPGA